MLFSKYKTTIILAIEGNLECKNMLYKIKFIEPETQIKQFIGDLELDFVNHKMRKPYNTVVFVGENGCGKTTTLQLIALSHGLLKDKDDSPYRDNPYIGYFDAEDVRDGELVILRYLFDTIDISFHASFIKMDLERYLDGKYEHMQQNFDGIQDEWSKNFRNECIYLENESQFIRNVQKSRYDDHPHDLKPNVKDSDYMIKENYNFLIQDIINIPHKDYHKLETLRFAINKFFAGNLEFIGIDERGNNKLRFRKNSVEMPIEELSSGEKQIVFRGAYIALNEKVENEPIVIIDEPELSMHPKWQQGILQYYRDLCTQDGEQTMQLFIATHSERVVEEALKDDENVLVIILKEKNGKIEFFPVKQDMLLLPSQTAAEVNYLAFNVSTIDYHISLYGYLQELLGKESVKNCDEYIERYIENHRPDDKLLYTKKYKYNDIRANKTTTYRTLPTYIRNAIDHPDSGYKYSQKEFEISIELLREILQDLKTNSVRN